MHMYRLWFIVSEYIIKVKLHSSCEIEDFVETHLCKLFVILRSRVFLNINVGPDSSNLACFPQFTGSWVIGRG